MKASHMRAVARRKLRANDPEPLGGLREAQASQTGGAKTYGGPDGITVSKHTTSQSDLGASSLRSSIPQTGNFHMTYATMSHIHVDTGPFHFVALNAR